MPLGPPVNSAFSSFGLPALPCPIALPTLSVLPDPLFLFNALLF